MKSIELYDIKRLVVVDKNAKKTLFLVDISFFKDYIIVFYHKKMGLLDIYSTDIVVKW